MAVASVGAWRLRGHDFEVDFGVAKIAQVPIALLVGALDEVRGVNGARPMIAVSAIRNIYSGRNGISARQAIPRMTRMDQ